jgi:hypothetical protein
MEVFMAEEAKRSTTALHPMRMRAAEYERTVYVADVSYGVSLDEVLKPSYWAHVATKLPPYTHIEARAEDGSWIAYLIVTGSDRTWARVAVDRVVNLTTKDVAETQATQHEVKWKGPALKYAVVRLHDDTVVLSGFRQREEAVRALQEHERVVGVAAVV